MRNRLVLMMWTAGWPADAEPMSHARRQSADLLVPEDQWRSMAACRSADPDLFFPISSSGRSMAQEAEAKTICAGCRVRRECLAFALRTHQAHGVWGGLSEQERHPVRSAALAGVKRGQAAQVDAVHAPDLRDDHKHA
jgi:WhiB family transcriptional regulator, redox-sensing transcriptional regulator